MTKLLDLTNAKIHIPADFTERLERKDFNKHIDRAMAWLAKQADYQEAVRDHKLVPDEVTRICGMIEGRIADDTGAWVGVNPHYDGDGDFHSLRMVHLYDTDTGERFERDVLINFDKERRAA